VDVKGWHQCSAAIPEHSLSLFIETSSLDELKRRLEARGTKHPKAEKRELPTSSYELKFKDNLTDRLLMTNLQKPAMKLNK
jgi:guanylate kinase